MMQLFKPPARGERETRIVADPPPPAENLPESRRCVCCGVPMPADIGEWILAPAIADGETVGVLILCSRECDEQIHGGKPC